MIELKFGTMKLSFDRERWWLIEDDGEAMVIRTEDIERMLAEYKRRNF